MRLARPASAKCLSTRISRFDDTRLEIGSAKSPMPTGNPPPILNMMMVSATSTCCFIAISILVRGRRMSLLRPGRMALMRTRVELLDVDGLLVAMSAPTNVPSSFAKVASSMPS